MISSPPPGERIKVRGPSAAMSVSVRNLQTRARVSAPRLGALARRALTALGRADREVHVTVVDDRRIRDLNARYLRKRAPTDVLAFNLEAPGLEAPGSSRLMGEVVISAETAARQARRLGVPLALELDLLLVHGLLHLVGYDDRDRLEARLMHERERDLLSRGRRRIPERLWSGLLRA